MDLDDDLVVRREIVVDAPVAALWEAVTDFTWLAPDAEMDLRPGGRGWVREDGGPLRHAQIDEVEVGHRLAFRWWAPGEDERSVTLTLAPEGGGSRLVVVERPALPTAQASAVRTGGWDGRLERLTAGVAASLVGSLA